MVQGVSSGHAVVYGISKWNESVPVPVGVRHAVEANGDCDAAGVNLEKTDDPAGREVGRLSDALAALVWGVSWGHRGYRRAGGSNGLRDSGESQPKDYADVAL